jgi:hypothetical protein
MADVERDRMRNRDSVAYLSGTVPGLARRARRYGGIEGSDGRKGRKGRIDGVEGVDGRERITQRDINEYIRTRRRRGSVASHSSSLSLPRGWRGPDGK